MPRDDLDTGVLLKPYPAGRGSQEIDRILGEAGPEFLVARLTPTEMISVLAE